MMTAAMILALLAILSVPVVLNWQIGRLKPCTLCHVSHYTPILLRNRPCPICSTPGAR